MHVNCLFVYASAVRSSYKMRSDCMSLLVTGSGLPGLTESSESRSCKGSRESNELN